MAETGVHRQKRAHKLMTKFRIMFFVFTLITVLLNTLTTYYNQQRLHRRECIRSLRETTDYIQNMISYGGEEFAELHRYFEEHFEDLLIPIDYDGDFTDEQVRFEELYEQNYPGKIFLKDITFKELEPETKCAYAVYRFEFWLNHFEQAKESFGLEYIYFILPEEDDQIIYMFDGVRHEMEVNGQNYIMTGVDATASHDDFPNLWKTWETGAPTEDFDVVKNTYGAVYTYYEPVIIGGEKIGLVGLDLKISNFNSTVWKAVLAHQTLSLLVLAITAIIMSIVIRQTILCRIEKLETQVISYAATKDAVLAEEIEMHSSTGDEIGSLSTQFASMIRELEEYMKNLQTVTAERERIGAELNVATNIQASMLPQIFPPFPDREEFDIYAAMSPAKEVGGDFYDFFMADEEHIAIVIADVSGKGVPAALFMVIAKTIIKNQAQSGLSAEEILTNANSQLDEENDEEMFVTVWLGLYNIRTGQLTFSEAGHESPLLLHENGEVEEIRPKKKRIPLGSMGGIRYLPNTMQLHEGDCLFLYTDGVPEATNASNEMYGMKRLTEFMQTQAGNAPAKLLRSVRENVDAFVGDAPQFDDLTMLALKVRHINAPPEDVQQA